VLDESHVVIHGSDTREHCVYDLDGSASQMSLGALIETLAIAASGFGLRADVVRRAGQAADKPIFEISLANDRAIVASPLIKSIPLRSVQRRPFSVRLLTSAEKDELAGALAPGYELQWHEGLGAKWKFARLMFANAKLRLTMLEAYRVHCAIIDWDRRYSESRVPDQALGADALTLRLMRWAMQDWQRVCFLNRYLAGTWAPRLQMDLLPSLQCAAHFVLFRSKPPRAIDDFVEAGRALQRLWLTATRLGLQHQPELTPLIFARYVREGVAFSLSTASTELARGLTQRTQRLIGPRLSSAVWIGRIGQAPAPIARSVRHSLLTLSIPGEGNAGR
jgi:hypothetical protein